MFILWRAGFIYLFLKSLKAFSVFIRFVKNRILQLGKMCGGALHRLDPMVFKVTHHHMEASECALDHQLSGSTGLHSHSYNVKFIPVTNKMCACVPVCLQTARDAADTHQLGSTSSRMTHSLTL